jgi:hypothetical protein
MSGWFLGLKFGWGLNFRELGGRWSSWGWNQSVSQNRLLRLSHFHFLGLWKVSIFDVGSQLLPKCTLRKIIRG